jgi:hypothetical protein
MTNRPRFATSRPLDVVTATLGRAAMTVAAAGLAVVGLAHLDGAPPAPAQTELVASRQAAAADAVDLVAESGGRTGPAGPSPIASDATAGWRPSGSAPAVSDSEAVVDAAAGGLPSRLTGGSAPDPDPEPSAPVAGGSEPAPPGPTTTAAPTSAPAPPPPSPAPAPTPRQAPASQQAEPAPEHIERIVRARFGDRADAALRVAHCESRYDPRAVSAGGGSWGLFQINRVHEDLVAELGYEWEDLLDPAVNTHVAKVLFDRAGGWSPWACAWAAR